jgi:hypothetical protein
LNRIRRHLRVLGGSDRNSDIEEAGPKKGVDENVRVVVLMSKGHI